MSANAYVLALALALVVAPAAARAAGATNEVKLLGGTNGWEAYLDDAQGGRICYLIGKPAKSDSGSLKRPDVMMSVTHRPAHKVVDVVNFSLGYRPKGDSPASLAIDGKAFSLFVDKDGAWTRDAETDLKVVTALAKGREALVRAEPAKGKLTVDRYDLKGFSAGLALIDKACNVAR
jgi:hypothetical protein